MVVVVVVVVVSLGFLALQVKQGNDIAQANMRHALIVANNIFHDLVIADAELGELLGRMGAANAEFADGKTQQVRAISNRLFNQWNAIHGAYTTGQIPQSVYDNWSAGVPSIMTQYPALIPFFAQLLESFPGVQGYPI